MSSVPIDPPRGTFKTTLSFVAFNIDKKLSVIYSHYVYIPIEDSSTIELEEKTKNLFNKKHVYTILTLSVIIFLYMYIFYMYIFYNAYILHKHQFKNIFKIKCESIHATQAHRMSFIHHKAPFAAYLIRAIKLKGRDGLSVNEFERPLGNKYLGYRTHCMLNKAQ